MVLRLVRSKTKAVINPARSRRVIKLVVIRQHQKDQQGQRSLQRRRYFPSSVILSSRSINDFSLWLRFGSVSSSVAGVTGGDFVTITRSVDSGSGMRIFFKKRQRIREYCLLYFMKASYRDCLNTRDMFHGVFYILKMRRFTFQSSDNGIRYFSQCIYRVSRQYRNGSSFNHFRP